MGETYVCVGGHSENIHKYLQLYSGPCLVAEMKLDFFSTKYFIMGYNNHYTEYTLIKWKSDYFTYITTTNQIMGQLHVQNSKHNQC